MFTLSMSCETKEHSMTIFDDMNGIKGYAESENKNHNTRGYTKSNIPCSL